MSALAYPPARCPGCGDRTPRNKDGALRRHNVPARIGKGTCRGPITDNAIAYALVYAFRAFRDPYTGPVELQPMPAAPPGQPYGGAACVTIGRGGHSVHKWRDAPMRNDQTGGWYSGTVSRIEGYDTSPARFLANNKNLIVPEDGIPIVYTAPAILAHGASVAMKAPLLDVTIEAPTATNIGPGTLADGLALAGGALGAMVAGARAGRINLNAVPVAEYVAYWKENGAHVGRILRIGGRLMIVWGAVTGEPDLYLSTSDGSWSVIWKGSSLCASTDETRARAVFEKALGVDTGLIWGGDHGGWITVSPPT